jgi:16S rRNA (guanine527-N7)-methyltransferase
MDLKRLETAAAALGVDAKPLVPALKRYLSVLLQWNAKINITSVRTEDEIVDRHFIDSLAIVSALPQTGTLIDVGSGGGFPGAIAAIARPALQVTLVEPVHKKTAFLQALKREVPIPNLLVETKRVEDMKGTWDVAVSRATWDLAEWLPIGARLVNEGGLVLGMEGAQLHELPEGATRHPYVLPDGSTRAIVRYLVPRG